MKALLVGNGFTSYLINNYSNDVMLYKFRKNNSDLFKKINELFQKFRLPVECLESFGVAYGYPGMYPGVTQLNRPITSLSFNKELKENILKSLSEYRFYDVEHLYANYFIDYGLIYETQKKSINNIESMLKVVHLFKKIDLFSDDEYSHIKKTANMIYYNKGNCELSHLDKGNRNKIKKYLEEFEFIFTTNYDLILDTASKKDIMHIHGGFNYSSRGKKHTSKLDFKNSFLVWGINSEQKYTELNRGTSYSHFQYSQMNYSGSLLNQYLKTLETAEISNLHIFGYSGENDGHINNAIHNNKNIHSIIYYTDPKEFLSPTHKWKVCQLFHQDDTATKLILKSWDDIWKLLI